MLFISGYLQKSVMDCCGSWQKLSMRNQGVASGRACSRFGIHPTLIFDGVMLLRISDATISRFTIVYLITALFRGLYLYLIEYRHDLLTSVT